MKSDRPATPADALLPLLGAVSASVAILGLAVMLTACGGGSGDVAQTPTPFAIAPVFDDNGQPSGAAKLMEPADPERRTRAGLYASPEQYQWEALISSPCTVLVDLDASRSMQAAIDSALAARDVQVGPTKLAWFVRASDARAGTQLADALTDAGLNPVFLIVGAAGGSRR